jgi:hypothetical protein
MRFDQGRGAQSFLALRQREGYLARAHGRGKLAGMHILKVRPHHLKVVLPAMATPQPPWIGQGVVC